MNPTYVRLEEMGVQDTQEAFDRVREFMKQMSEAAPGHFSTNLTKCRVCYILLELPDTTTSDWLEAYRGVCVPALIVNEHWRNEINEWAVIMGKPYTDYRDGGLSSDNRGVLFHDDYHHATPLDILRHRAKVGL